MSSIKNTNDKGCVLDSEQIPTTSLQFDQLESTSLTSENESDFFQDNKSTTANAKYETTPDHVLTLLGCKNVYILLIWLGTATCWGLAAMPMMASTFFMDLPCKKHLYSTNHTIDEASNDRCEKTSPTSCNIRNGTLIQDFGLVYAEDDMFNIPRMSTAMFLLGIIIGAILFPRASDRIGRHPVLCFSLIMSGVIGTLSAIVPYIEMFVACRFIQGFCFPGMSITNWVLAYESIPQKLRSYTALLFGICWVIGYCSIGPLAYLMPNWRWLAFSASIPSVFFGLIYLNFLPESFHWMTSVGDEKRVEQWLNRANFFARKFGTRQVMRLRIRHFCSVNRTRSHPNWNGNKKQREQQVEPQQNISNAIEGSFSTTTVITSAENTEERGGENQKNFPNESPKNHTPDSDHQSPTDLKIMVTSMMPHTLVKESQKKKRSRHLFWYTAIFAYLWTCNTFIYYGLSLFSTKLVGDVYLNYVYVGLVEIPSYIVSPFFLDRFGRKCFIAGAHFIAAITYIVIAINDMLPDWISRLHCPLESVTLIMWLVGKFAISCSFTSLFVYASEIFPTATRNTNIGICAACSRFGATLVPFVQQMSRGLQLAMFGASAFVGTLITLFLPETKNKDLPASSAEIPRKRKSISYEQPQ